MGNFNLVYGCLIAGILSSGCTPGSVTTKKLQEIKSGRVIVLKNDITYFRKYPFSNSRNYGLKACRYKAVYQDKEGIFYLGKGKCFIDHLIRANSTTYWQGGIWVPDPSSSLKPRIFVILTKDFENPNDLVEYLANLEAGKYRKLRVPRDDRFNQTIMRRFSE